MDFDDAPWEDDEPWEGDPDMFDEPSELSEPLEKFEGDVYYDSRMNRFVQLRKRSKDKLVFGDFCEYYEDAQTCIITQTRPVDYLEHLVKIENIKKFDKAEYDGIGWCIKGAFKDLDDLVQSMTPRRRR